MKLPTLEQISRLHQKYAPTKEALESVWGHCQIVREIALQTAGTQPAAAKRLISAGALLHDIGVYRLYHDGVLDGPNYITHGLLGYQLLKEEGFDEELCRFALNHTGVGITKEDIETGKLPLPVADYLAGTTEERIVMYADKFHSKDPSIFNSAEWYGNYLAQKFGRRKQKLFEAMVQEFGEPDLAVLAARHSQIIR